MQLSSNVQAPLSLKSPTYPLTVIPAKAGIHNNLNPPQADWIPVFTCLFRHGRQAGMTERTHYSKLSIFDKIQGLTLYII